MKQISLRSTLAAQDFNNKRVLLRVDMNVPLENGVILNDYRLQAILPTIDLIQEKNGKVILASHIGRPKGADSNLSTKNLLPWFQERGYTMDFEPDLEEAPRYSFENSDTILLLENLRFFPGEKTYDEIFAKQLADCADYYVQDAFAVLHRSDTSVTLTPHLFEKDHRLIGPLVEKELVHLNKLIADPKKPFVLIIGGGKITSKLPLLLNMLDLVDTILLCPAAVFTPLKSLGKPVGKSLVDDKKLNECKELLSEAEKKNVTIMFPVDYQVADQTIDGPLSIVDADAFSENAVGVSIGPKTAELFAQEIKSAGTIFYNGAMGFHHRPDTLEGMRSVFQAMQASNAYTVVGGGDSITTAQRLGFGDAFSFCSTGGGATLTYLSGHELPGLSPFV